MADNNFEYLKQIEEQLAKDPTYLSKLSKEEVDRLVEAQKAHFQSLSPEEKLKELKDLKASIDSQKDQIPQKEYESVIKVLDERAEAIKADSLGQNIQDSLESRVESKDSTPIPESAEPAKIQSNETYDPIIKDIRAKESVEPAKEEKKKLTDHERRMVARSQLEQKIATADSLSKNPKTLMQSYEVLKEAEKHRGKIGYENFDYYMKSHDQIRDIKKCGLESLLTSADEASKSSNSAVQALQLIDYVKEAAGYLNPFDTLRWKSASKADKIKKQAYESLVSTIKAGAKIPESAVQTLESISKTEEMLKNSYNILSPYRFQAGRELKEAKKTTLESMYRLAEDKIHSGDASGAMAMLEAADIETKKLGYFDSFAGYLKSRSKDITAMCGLRYMDAAEQKISSEAEGDKEAAKELVNKAKEISDKLGFFDSIRKQLDYRINRAYSTLA